MNLYQQWIEAKAAEGAALAERRRIEEELSEALGIPANLDGSKRVEDGGYKVTVTGRINRKVDTQKVQEVAAENGIGWDVLTKVFRWKAEIDKRSFDNSKDEIRAALSAAITSKPGKPSYKIEKIEE